MSKFAGSIRGIFVYNIWAISRILPKRHLKNRDICGAFRRLFVSLRLEETAEIQDTNETNIVIKDSSIGTTKIFSLMKVDLSFDIIPKELRISPSTKFHNLPKSICI